MSDADPGRRCGWPPPCPTSPKFHPPDESRQDGLKQARRMGKTPIMLAWRDHADFARVMIALANRRQLAMCGMSRRAAFRYVETIVADAEVVIGVWQDPREPNGVGLHVIKGLRHLMTATDKCGPARGRGR